LTLFLKAKRIQTYLSPWEAAARTLRKMRKRLLYF